MIIKLLLFGAGILSLYYGATWFVNGSSRIATILKITPLVIGMTIVAFGTSAPELMVSLLAILKDEPDITLGNVIGSNIANIGLVLGVSALVKKLECHVKTIRLEIPIMIASSLLLLALAVDGEITRGNGVILLIGIVLFVLHSYRSSKLEIESLPAEVREKYEKLACRDRNSLLRVISKMGAGLCFLLLGAQFVIDSAVSLADDFGVSHKIIALSMVAVGTSLPELATSVVAAARDEHDISIGNIIGSSIFNLLCIIGVIAVISPIKVSSSFSWDFVVMLGMSLILIPMIAMRGCISRRGGVFLLILYSLYIGWLALQM
jgi:cation:H+ antiporter